MKPVRFVIFTILAGLTPPTAFASVDIERLIQGCEELTVMMSSREKQKFLAGLTTSVSEAMRAGYCMGVIDEYQRTNRCAVRDWHLLASRIAEVPDWHSDTRQISSLMRNACDR